MDERQNDILKAVISGQEKEKNEIARELHDNINQVLATIKMYLGIAKSDKSRSEEMIEVCFECIDEAITEIRGLSHSLVAPSLKDMTLFEALRQMTDEVNWSKQLNVKLIDKTNGNISDPNKELAFYRIAQEQMSNVLKHSRASEVTICLENKGDDLTMTITDNGEGFDQARTSEGIGLKNVFNRVSVYSGEMNIRSAPGQGCSLEVSIPK